MGLELNEGKSEVLCADPVIRDFVLNVFQGAKVVYPSCASLLGSPIGDENSISKDAISRKTSLLQAMGERLQHVSVHDSLLLLCNSFAISKLLYLLRTSPSFLSERLLDYDVELRSIVCVITNTDLDDDAWLQASLPVKHGGLGIRSAAHITPSAFLSSASASSDLVHFILPRCFESKGMLHADTALTSWSLNLDHPPLQGPASQNQKVWDAYRVRAVAVSLLERAQDVQTRARLMASRTKESGAWLNALNKSSYGLRMDDNTVRVAVGLRLGTTLCHPHSCHHCGTVVNNLGPRGLSCERSEGRHHRHSALNDIVHRALTTARIPSRLEPAGVSRVDGKRPDGITIVPWKQGKLLMWNATCSDSFTPSYVDDAAHGAGNVATVAEAQKKPKYSNLSGSHMFGGGGV